MGLPQGADHRGTTYPGQDRLDPAGLGVPERIPQQFPGDPVDLVLEQRLQIPRDADRYFGVSLRARM